MTTATIVRSRDFLATKNKKTGKAESIVQHDLAIADWGLRFFVDGELEAYKAAYEYRHAQHGYKVEYAAGAGKWCVTVFNETAKLAGIDGAK